MRAPLLAGLLLLGACVYDPQFQDGRTRCATGTFACPNGFGCDRDRDAGVCRRLQDAATEPPPDGAAPLDTLMVDDGTDLAPPGLTVDARDSSEAPDNRTPADGSLGDAPLVDAPLADAPVADTAALDTRPAVDAAPDCANEVICKGSTGNTCDDDKVVLCEVGPRGCLVVTRVVDTCKPPTKPCQGSAPNARCACLDEPPICNHRTGSYCAVPGDTMLGNCSVGPDGCFQTASSSCQLGMHCQGTFPTAGCSPP
jgi:hypothetical protein